MISKHLCSCIPVLPSESWIKNKLVPRMGRIELSNEELVQLVLLCKRDGNACARELSARHPCLSLDDISELKKFISQSFLPQFYKLWRSTSRSLARLRRNHNEWLKGRKVIELGDRGSIQDSSEHAAELVEAEKVGRKRKAFDDCGSRTKKNRVAELRATFSARICRSVYFEQKGHRPQS